MKQINMVDLPTKTLRENSTNKYLRDLKSSYDTFLALRGESPKLHTTSHEDYLQVVMVIGQIENE